jgi:hypothetical protein
MTRNYKVVIDKSGSMMTTDCPNGKSRWDYCQESAFGLASKCDQLDPDGIDVYMFASKFKKYSNVHADMVSKLFKENEPSGGTTLAPVLQDIFDEYFKNPETPIAVAVVTDGEPSDQSEVVKTIIAATKKMEKDEQIGIQFVQIGKDEGAAAFLKRLDDNLTAEGAKFDIVDTVTMAEQEDLTLTEILTRAITD